MKHQILASALLVAVSVCAVATSASAQSDPVATCAAINIVNPNPNSTYTSVPTAIIPSTGPEYEQSRTTTASTPGGVLLGTTPAQFVPGSEGRNGGSPNIHGEFKSTATYSGGSLSQTVVYAQDTTNNYGCLVTRTQPNGNVTAPPGLQVTGLFFTVTNVTRTEYESVSAPNVTTDYFSEGVICNSPGTKRGEWRPQNGYAGVCSTERYLALGSAFVHTNSVPGLPPINAQADHSTSGASGFSLPPTVTETDPENSDGSI